MSTLAQPRQPQGTPVGGQFATGPRPEGDVELSGAPAHQHEEWQLADSADGGAYCRACGDSAPEPARDWGEVSVKEGARTPWGPADFVEDLGPGAVSVSTAGHGGIKLSAERNKAVPALLRNANGWYEEDCEAHIVSYAHPDLARAGEDPETRVRQWFPDAYEQLTGKVIPAGESRVKDERVFREQHAEDQIVVSAARSTSPGMVEVTTTTGGSRTPDAFHESRTFLVPADEYDQRGPLGFVVDPSRHAETTQPKPERVPAARYHGVDLTGLTSFQRARAQQALAGRWRMDDGTVKSLAQILETEGVSGKSVYVDDSGTRTYQLAQKGYESDSSYASFPVPKALWDAVDAPDTRTAKDRAREEYQVATARVERTRRRGSRDAIHRAEAALTAARAALDAATD